MMDTYLMYGVKEDNKNKENYINQEERVNPPSCKKQGKDLLIEAT